MPKPESAKLEHDRAYRQGVQRTIPTSRATKSVTTSADTLDLAPYKGKFIFLKASGAEITMLRDGGGGAITAGNGFVLAPADAREEVFVDPGGELILSVIAGAAATLVILYDAE